MERLNPNPQLYLLRQVNAGIAAFCEYRAARPVVGAAADLLAGCDLQANLDRAGELLANGILRSRDGDTRREVMLYRDNLFKLQVALSGVRASALRQREILQSQKAHSKAVSAWCASSSLLL